LPFCHVFVPLYRVFVPLDRVFVPFCRVFSLSVRKPPVRRPLVWRFFLGLFCRHTASAPITSGITSGGAGLSTCVCMKGFCFPRYFCISFNIVCARVRVCVRFSPSPPPCIIVVFLLTYLCVCVSLPSTCVCMEGFCFPPYCCISYNIVCARVCVCAFSPETATCVIVVFLFTYLCVCVS